jgi:hypothetical protein
MPNKLGRKTIVTVNVWRARGNDFARVFREAIA